MAWRSLIVFLAGALVSAQLIAGHPDDYNVAVVIALDGLHAEDDFDQYELVISQKIHRQGWSNSRRQLRLNYTVGAIESGGDIGYLVSAGPDLLLSGRSLPSLWLDLGIRASLLTRDSFRDKRFGQSLQFISHIGTRYDLWHNISAGYRFQHMSNAGLSSDNPGLDLAILWVTFHF